MSPAQQQSNGARADSGSGDAQSLFQLGRRQMQNGELMAARKSFEAALAIEPRRASFVHHLSVVLGRLGLLDKAIASARKALELKIDVASFHSNLGTLLLRKGDMNGAEAGFRGALAIDPNFAQALHGLSRVLESRGDIVRAVKSSERAVEQMPSNPAFREQLKQLSARLEDD